MSKPITFGEVSRHLREIGVTVRPTGVHGMHGAEYVVKLRGERTDSASAYFTDDLSDALATGIRIAQDAGTWQAFYGLPGHIFRGGAA